MKQRIVLYDNAKGIGIILLIFGHLFTYGNVPFSLIFAFHMPLFFVISGLFFTPPHTENTKKWIAKIIVRYSIPFFFFTVLGGLASYILYGSMNLKIALYQFIMYIGMDECTTASLWYLGVLIMSLLLMLPLERYCSNTVRKVIVICGLIILSYYSANCNYTLPFRIKAVFTTTLFILVGYFLKDYVGRIKNVSWKCFLLALLVFIMTALSNKTVNISIPVYNDYSFFLITASLGIVITLWVSGQRFLKNSRFLSFLGENSLIIFCTHKIWIVVFVKIINLLTNAQFMYMVDLPNTYCILGGLFVIVVSIPTVYVIRPMYNFINRSVLSFMYNKDLMI